MCPPGLPSHGLKGAWADLTSALGPAEPGCGQRLPHQHPCSYRRVQPHLGHEVDPATGGIVDGVQLLEQDAGIGQGEVAVEEVVENIAVRDIQDLWMLVEVSGELGQRGRHRREKLGCVSCLSAPVLSTDTNRTHRFSWGQENIIHLAQGTSLVLTTPG